MDKKKVRRLKNLTISEVSLVDRPANNKVFALIKNLADLTDHDEAVVATTFEAQDLAVQADILKRLLVGDMKLDLKLLNKACEKFGQQRPAAYAHCIRHPEDLVVEETQDGDIVVSKRESGIAERDGRVFVVDDCGRGKWVPKK
jgi:hypothetical protein